MKHFISIILYLLLAQHMYPQTQKGHWLVGVNVGSGTVSHENAKITYSSSGNNTENDTKSFNLAAGPTALYFIKDNLAIGATIGIAYKVYKNEQNGVMNKSHLFPLSFNPEVRKYFGKPGAKGLPWVSVFGGINTIPGKGEYEQPYYYLMTKSDVKYTGHGWNAGAGVGYSHFLNQHVAIQYFVNYQHSWLKTKANYKDFKSILTSKTNSNNFNFGVGLQIHLSKKGK
jgi:outer membrane protein W